LIAAATLHTLALAFRRRRRVVVILAGGARPRSPAHHRAAFPSLGGVIALLGGRVIIAPDRVSE
jgi:hypothetical protein